MICKKAKVRMKQYLKVLKEKEEENRCVLIGICPRCGSDISELSHGQVFSTFRCEECQFPEKIRKSWANENCKKCGGEIVWDDCISCDGSGKIEPYIQKIINCPICNGEGGKWICGGCLGNKAMETIVKKGR